ncbi:MAG: Sua5 YciO YrdC YwlC family protein [Arcobacteraceae bacterium]|jgi:tRNA A37 threonylcarbamoyladenosine synthetase subunit TsaC/SUA5/YrdC|nr:Sua5 YciO YrdC YwlC family protein [Arcobacteraceae bacterium]
MDKNKIYLVQTDTTVGLLSRDDRKLSVIKKRAETQKILQAVDSFATLQKYTRVPNIYKKLVRNSNRTTFIYPNGDSFRVVDNLSFHHNFISKFQNLYSTSANETTKKFDFDFAYNSSNIIVFSKNDFFESSGSSILKITNFKKKKIR